MTPPDFKLDELLALADEQNPSLRSLRARQDAATWSVRAAQARSSCRRCQCRPDGAGSPRSSPTTTCSWDRRCPARSRRGGLPLQQPGEDGAQPRRPGGRLLRGVRAQLHRHRAADPKRGEHPSATRTTSSLSTTPASRSAPTSGSRCRSSPASAGRSGSPRPGRRSRTPTRSVRARRLQVRTDVQARHLALKAAFQAIAVQAANRDGRARPASAGAGPLPPGRGHLARGLRRAERGPAGRRRLRERGLCLSPGHRRAGGRGRPTPSLTRNAHVAWDEDRSGHRGRGCWQAAASSPYRINKKKNAGTEVRMEQVSRRDLVSAVTASGKIEPQDLGGHLAPTSPAASSRSRCARATWCSKGQFLIQIDPAAVPGRGVTGAEGVVSSTQATLLQMRANRDQAERALEARGPAASAGTEPHRPRDGRAGPDTRSTSPRRRISPPGRSWTRPAPVCRRPRTTWPRPASSAPIAGRVVRLAVEEGEVAVPGHLLARDRPAA